MANEWYVISGAPGSGKTTLVNYLASLGFATVPEAARLVIDHELAEGTPLDQIRSDELAFQHKVLAQQVATEKRIPPDRVTFFDRGVPDSAAYYMFKHFEEDAALIDALRTCVYKKVFLLEPLSVIVDYARRETKEEQLEIYEHVKRVYGSMPFPIVHVPALSIEDRAQYVLARMNSTD